MASQKKILKVFVIIILAVFLASTALMSVLYLSNNNKSEDTNTSTGDVVTGALDENLSLTGETEEVFQ